MRLHRSIVTAFALLGFAGSASATILQDQQNGGVQINFYEPIGQSFTAEESRVSIGFYFQPVNLHHPADQITLRLLNGEGAGGALLAESTFTLDAGFIGYHDVDFSSVALETGGLYTAMLSVPTDSAYWFMQLSTGWMGDLYTGGRLIMGGTVPELGHGFPENADARFRVMSVPAPSTISLMLAALLGAAVLRRRRSWPLAHAAS